MVGSEVPLKRFINVLKLFQMRIIRSHGVSKWRLKCFIAIRNMSEVTRHYSLFRKPLRS
jgi:hypothetical protein